MADRPETSFAVANGCQSPGLLTSYFLPASRANSIFIA